MHILARTYPVVGGLAFEATLFQEDPALGITVPVNMFSSARTHMGDEISASMCAEELANALQEWAWVQQDL
jgi:hypothetical protein